ncbi:MAG: M4 family peptidase [Chloroflexota bacterium]|nr:MAG: M4 family peptidase [Chloroflexota bacterium]
MKKLKFMFVLLAVSAMLLGSTRSVLSQSEEPNYLVEKLQQVTGNHVELAYHDETGMVSFIGVDPEFPIRISSAMPAAASAEMVSRAFLAEYGSLFGLTNATEELAVMRMTASEDGRSFVRFQQVYKGIPVMAGEIIVQTGMDQAVYSAGGEVLPDLNVAINPTLDAETARRIALEAMAKQYELGVEALQATQPELWIYNPVLLGGGGRPINTLVWHIEVTPVELLPIRELVLVDAQLGVVALSFNQVDTVKNRLTYDAGNTPALPGTLRRSEGQANIGDAEVDRAHNYAGDTYDFYSYYHARDGINNLGMVIKSTVRYCSPSSPCPYENAFWNGEQMVYGQGYASADDVVAHELSHGVTEFESHLYYYMQSGAINEALSDIFGEFVDQNNGDGGPRWLMGEDLPIGAIRSMSNPPQFQQPDRMTSSLYRCGETDQGWVHNNSGVANKAAYLMVDGGTFNNVSVGAIGFTKTAWIWYDTQTNLLTSGSDYSDLSNYLQQSCRNLSSKGYVTSADCAQVKNALTAVEMAKNPVGCAAVDAPICPSRNVVSSIFTDSMENPATNSWISAATTGLNQWFYPQTTNPYGYDATYATSGGINMWGYDYEKTADYYIAMTRSYAIPTGKIPYMRFNHAFTFDGANYDGGVVEYSIDNGVTWVDAGSLMTDNPYRGSISAFYGNPLGGRQAFVGKSSGYISTRLNLSTLAGKNVRFRFRLGTDTSQWGYGWFIDDVSIYTCMQRFALNMYIPWPTTPTPTSQVPPTVPPTTAPPTPIPTTPVANTWTTLLTEDFEGSFPGSRWTLQDISTTDGGEYLWAKSPCKPYAGTYSGWGFGGGTTGGTLACSSNYPDDAFTRMIAGPFDLSDAQAADLSYMLWLDVESCSSGCDMVCRLASPDGIDWNNGYCTTGKSIGWENKILNIGNVNGDGATSYLGDSSVWIALEFYSDISINYPEGGFVDNIVLRKCTTTSCTGSYGPVDNTASGTTDIPYKLASSK